ncbi:uncharacterized protein [Spinacia oleracea]|uniref:RRM domain-containing protein n=1 Tax=Spinacia oleracea TaxID=3562 RepID=A0ABM3RH46_SPIOL|nr:uncharacterized protein LOC110792251 [Spinacia oleracea]
MFTHSHVAILLCSFTGNQSGDFPIPTPFPDLMLLNVWVARRPPGYAFIDFDDTRDAKYAIHALDGGAPRVFVGHSIYKGKAALTVEPKAPEFLPLDVIMDVVFNHTAEGNEKGPIFSFRGTDNCIFYMLASKVCLSVCHDLSDIYSVCSVRQLVL